MKYIPAEMQGNERLAEKIPRASLNKLRAPAV